MRSFRLPDLLWLEPIAKKYGEWESMIEALHRARSVMVEPKHSIVCLHDDEHGLCFSALSDEKGVKDFIRMVEDVVLLCDDEGVGFHGHYEPGTWQAKVAEKMGLKRENDMYVFRPRIGGRDVLRRG